MSYRVTNVHIVSYLYGYDGRMWLYLVTKIYIVSYAFYEQSRKLVNSLLSGVDDVRSAVDLVNNSLGYVSKIGTNFFISCYVFCLYRVIKSKKVTLKSCSHWLKCFLQIWFCITKNMPSLKINEICNFRCNWAGKMIF